MTMRRRPWLFAGTIYSLLASATILLSRLDGGVSLVWLANGFLIPWLASARRREWRATLLACFVGNAVPTIWFGAGWLGLGLPLVNIAEAVGTVLILRRWLGKVHYLDSIEGLGKFALVAVFTPMLCALPAAGIAWIAMRSGIPHIMLNWFAGHSLGVLLIAPVADLTLRYLRGRRHKRARRAFGAHSYVVWLTPVLVIAVGTFVQNAMPLLFLPLVPMMIATLRLGRPGATGSLMILALVASVATHLGRGPIELIVGSAVMRLQFLQVYLAAAAIIVLPVAVLMRQRRVLLKRLSASEGALRLMAESSGDAMLLVSAPGRIIRATGSLEALIGRDATWLTGRYATELVVPEDRKGIVAAHQRLMADRELTINFEYRGQLADGRTRWFESRGRAVLDADGQTVGTISAIRDIDERKRAETVLEREATTDALTGLLNRRAFFAYFEVCTSGGQGGVIIVADLDHFKTVNDRFGHHIGDLALQNYAKVARSVLRDSDIVARIGGEEFAFFLPGARLDERYALSERVRAALNDAQFDTGRGRFERLTASMGMVAVAATDEPAAALKRADAALYAAKEAGRDCLRLAA